jgi:hypothetical protein
MRAAGWVVTACAGLAALLIMGLVVTHPADETARRFEESARQPAQVPAPNAEGAPRFLTSRSVQQPPAAETRRPLDHKTITGWVVDADGKRVAHAQVGASSSEGATFASSDAEGRFELSNLPSEVVSVFATAPGRSTDHAQGIVGGTSELVLIVGSPGVVRGTVEARGLAHLFVRACRYSEHFRREICFKSEYSSPPARSYELSRLSPGEFDLVFVSEDEELFRQRVELLPGEELVLPAVDLRTAVSSP